MSRRPAIRTTDIKSTLAALRDAGLTPCALDTLPDGTYRWHFTPLLQDAQNDLDRELAEFDRKHGYS